MFRFNLHQSLDNQMLNIWTVQYTIRPVHLKWPSAAHWHIVNRRTSWSAQGTIAITRTHPFRVHWTDCITTCPCHCRRCGKLACPYVSVIVSHAPLPCSETIQCNCVHVKRQTERYATDGVDNYRSMAYVVHRMFTGWDADELDDTSNAMICTIYILNQSQI